MFIKLAASINSQGAYSTYTRRTSHTRAYRQTAASLHHPACGTQHASKTSLIYYTIKKGMHSKHTKESFSSSSASLMPQHAPCHIIAYTLHAQHTYLYIIYLHIVYVMNNVVSRCAQKKLLKGDKRIIDEKLLSNLQFLFCSQRVVVGHFFEVLVSARFYFYSPIIFRRIL